MPYGSAVFFVDGQCRFFASRDIRQGFATGTLSAEHARDLGRDLAFTEVSRSGAPSFYPRSSSVDIPVQFLSTRDGMVSCSCGCPAQAPQAIADALASNALHWLQRLLDHGEPFVPGAVSALAIADNSSSSSMPGGASTWPLTQSMTDVPGLVLSGMSDSRWYRGPYARIEGAAEIAALRALREVDLAAHPSPTAGSQVVDGAGTYRMYIRDELPEQLEQAVEAFLEHAAQIPRTP